MNCKDGGISDMTETGAPKLQPEGPASPAVCLCKDKHINQWDRIKIPDIYDQLACASPFNMGKNGPLTNSDGIPGFPHVKQQSKTPTSLKMGQ
jgi:hypothetical protein